MIDWNEQYQERRATVDSIRALKNTDQRMIEVTAIDADEAAAAEEAGIELLITEPSYIAAVRAGSKECFLTAAIDFLEDGTPLTVEDSLRAAGAAMDAGADAVVTQRPASTVAAITKHHIPVMGHVGFVPRRSTFFGGVRAVGKSAEEAAVVWDEIRALEDAGAFSVECELIAAEMFEEMTKRTSLATIALGSGSAADIYAMFTTDICGQDDYIPRHARVYADLKSMYADIQTERIRALTAFAEDVYSYSYPDDSETVHASAEEHERFLEIIDKRR